MAIVKCDDNDVALVMRVDGQIEVHAARRFEPGESVPGHVVVALTLAERLEDQEFCRDLMAWARARCEEILAADKQTVN